MVISLLCFICTCKWAFIFVFYRLYRDFQYIVILCWIFHCSFKVLVTLGAIYTYVVLSFELLRSQLCRMFIFPFYITSVTRSYHNIHHFLFEAATGPSKEVFPYSETKKWNYFSPENMKCLIVVVLWLSFVLAWMVLSYYIFGFKKTRMQICIFGLSIHKKTGRNLCFQNL